MTGETLTGTYDAGVTLSNPSAQNPATLTGAITIANGTDAASGTALFGGGTYSWSFANQGTVSSTGSVGVGVYLDDGGAVTNGVPGSTAAVVTASTLGVYINNTAGSVANFGSIESTYGRGVFLRGGGSVVNGQSGQTTGLISGGFIAVSIYRGTGSVTNFGAIEGGQSAGLGVELYAGQVINAAGALITGAYGVGAVGGAATVDNAGTIEGSQRDGVALLYGGYVGNAGSSPTAAVITGIYNGVLITGDPGTVVNAGSIGGTKVGVQLDAGGSLANAANAVITGSYGVLFYDGALSGTPTFAGSLTNLGTIEGSSVDGVALLADASLVNGTAGAALGLISAANYGVLIESTTATLRNYGTIEGLTGVYGRAVTANNIIYAPVVTLINAGLIDGTGGTAVSLFDSNDLLVVEPSARFIGGINGGTGTLELAAGIGALGGLGTSITGFDGITVDPLGTWALSGLVGATTSLVNDGVITIAAGTTLQARDNVIAASGSAGLIEIGASADAGLLAAIGADEEVYFAGAGGTLDLAEASAVAGPISGFLAGDTIDLMDASLSGLTFGYSGNTTAGTLTLKENGTAYAALTLDGGYTAASFHLAADPNGGSDILTTAPPCFAAGSRILTRRGEVAVEALMAGEQVITAAGRAAPIVWIGRRVVFCRGHREPGQVMPVRICAEAFGPGRPHRDLLLSPDHAVAGEGVLIPVHCLVNGRTILQEPVDRITYFHVELPGHDLLVAEGLAVESFFDNGNRARFTSAAAMRGAGLRASPESYAPLMLTGAAVARMRQRLLARALLLGHAGGTLAVLAVGQAFSPARVSRLRHSFVLPEGTREVQLLRGCDVALAGLLVDGRPVPLESSALRDGFHPIERRRGRSWRRFEALAGIRLPAPPAPAPVLLEVLLHPLPASPARLSRVA